MKKNKVLSMLLVLSMTLGLGIVATARIAGLQKEQRQHLLQAHLSQRFQCLQAMMILQRSV